MPRYFIGADVDSKMTELAVELNQRVVKRCRVATTIPAIRAVLDELKGRKSLTFEEGPMAGWLYRNLKDCVDELVVSDPRRNRLISDDGDKDDPIDAGKQAELLRGGFLRPVYHSEDLARVELKQWVGLYHDRVREAVRQINKIRGRGRMYGVSIPGRVLRGPKLRAGWLKELDCPALAGQLEVLWIGYDAVRRQVRQALAAMNRQAKAYPIIGWWDELPGVGPIRAATMFAYLDTPYRFGSVKALAKYCGVGLVRTTSGTDRKGQPRVGQVKLVWAYNHPLKDATVGATLSAIRQGHNPFADYYGGLVRHGLTTGNAMHSTARKLLGVMWGMWKSNSRFDPAACAADPRNATE
jgi:transposase